MHIIRKDLREYSDHYSSICISVLDGCKLYLGKSSLGSKVMNMTVQSLIHKLGLYQSLRLSVTIQINCFSSLSFSLLRVPPVAFISIVTLNRTNVSDWLDVVSVNHPVYILGVHVCVLILIRQSHTLKSSWRLLVDMSFCQSVFIVVFSYLVFIRSFIASFEFS